MKKQNSLQRLPRNIWAVTLTSFFTDVSSEMIFNLVPLFLANVLGVGTAVIGLVDGIAETTASLMKVYAGALSDKLGQRKWLAVAGYALSTISKPFLFFANTWGWVLGVRFSDRLGKGIRTAPRDALVADSIDENQRGLAFGVHRAGDTAGAFLGLLAVAVIGAAGFVFWAETPQGPAPEALAALKSDGQVNVTQGDLIVFAPVNQKPTTGFIFYPGGHVDARSYSVTLHQIAAQGYLVVVVPVRLNLAFFDVNAADKVFGAYPDIQHWVISGHSLGGVAAALYAEKHLDKIEGILFWASYPADDALKNSSIKVLTIYGTNDMAGAAKFDQTKSLLPADAQYIIIQGGNHGQFGDYGAQPGDNAATISRTDQQQQIVDGTVKFLGTFSK